MTKYYNVIYSPNDSTWKAACETADRLPTKCSCQKSRPKELWRQEGYSDSLVIIYKCVTCGIKYAKYVEG